jgi:hypothetical protein
MDDVIVLSSRGQDDYLFCIIETTAFKELARFGLQGKRAFEIGVMGSINKINRTKIFNRISVNKNECFFVIL